MAALADEIDRRKLKVEIAVDGGIAADTAATVTAAGATVLIAGAAVFGTKDYAAAIRSIREAGERGAKDRDARRKV